MPFTPAQRTVCTLLAFGLLPTLGSANDAKHFYQANKSVADALVFIGIAQDKLETYKGSVSGNLPTAAEKAIVDKLVRVHAEKSVALFLEVVGKPSVEALKAHVGNDGVVERVIGSIKEGAYLGVQPGGRYFATYKVLSADESAKYLGHKAMKYDPLPSATITFYSFSNAQNRLIGTRIEVHKSGNTYKILLPIFG